VTSRQEDQPGPPAITDTHASDALDAVLRRLGGDILAEPVPKRLRAVLQPAGRLAQ
jgi:hypothetical protein